MLFYSFNNFYFLLPFFYFFFELWVLFFKLNLDQKIKNFKKDHYNKINNAYKQHFYIYININIFFIFYIFLFFYILRGQSINFFWNHLLLSNFVLYLMFCTFLINFILLIITKQITYSNVNYSYDYFFSLVNLSIFLPLLFLSNNIFSFFFLLELNSCLIFYKLVVSKLWYLNLDNSFNKFSKIFSKNYLNLIFYQFWVTFFSTVLIIFFFFKYKFYVWINKLINYKLHNLCRQ